MTTIVTKQDADRNLLARVVAKAPSGGPAVMRRPRRRWRHLTWAVLSVVCVGAGGVWWQIYQAPQADAAPLMTTGELPRMSPPAPTVDDVMLEASGYVVARKRSSIASDITGRISSISVDLGDTVREGAVIATLDDREAQIRLAAARLGLEQAMLSVRAAALDLDEAQRSLQRMERLEAVNGTSEESVDAIRTEVERGEVRLEVARLQHAQANHDVRAAEIFVERHVVRAPFDGVVVEVPARPGETVSPASSGSSYIRTAIALLVDPDDLYVEAEIPEQQLAHVRPGQPVRVSGGSVGNDTVTAEISWISAVSDRQRGLVEVGIDLPSGLRVLLDGMEVDVDFVEPAIDLL